MRIQFGYVIIIGMTVLFSIALLGAMNEYNSVESLEMVLSENVKLDEIEISKNSYIYDYNGKIISEIYSGENRIALEYNQIPKYVIDAFISTEDQLFFTHEGFDMNGIIRALLINAKENEIKQGGSTITQQLVRNIYLNNEKSYNRKLSELLYAYTIEQKLPKEKILESYINTIYFGNQAYGIEAASQFYFQKPSSKLTLGEIAFLCSIPNNPTFYDPIVHLNNTLERKKWVLTKMLENGSIDQHLYNQALTEGIALNPSKKIDQFPDYVSYVHFEFKNLVGEMEGFKDQLNNAIEQEEKQIQIAWENRVNELLRSGVKIYTSMQPTQQENVTQIINQGLPYDDIQGSIVVINHHTHEITALSGGKNYKKTNFHRAFQAYRQPGSAIKPLLVFGPYIAETGASLNSTISASNFCSDGYCPENYTGKGYGTVTLESALYNSFNTSAVRMLKNIGVENGFKYLNSFRFSKVVKDDYVLPSAIGGFTYGMTPLEMTGAYTVFANDGKYFDPHGIKKVTDYDGNLLFEWPKTSNIVWDTGTNEKMRQLLHSVVTKGTGRSAQFSSAYIGGKTGTTNNFHDLWFIGLNENYTVGVWVGKDKPESIQNISSRAPHLSLWKDVMTSIAE